MLNFLMIKKVVNYDLQQLLHGNCREAQRKVLPTSAGSVAFFQKRPLAPQRSAFLFVNFFFAPLLAKKKWQAPRSCYLASLLARGRTFFARANKVPKKARTGEGGCDSSLPVTPPSQTLSSVSVSKVNHNLSCLPQQFQTSYLTIGEKYTKIISRMTRGEPP